MTPLRATAKGNPFEQRVADFLGTERRVLRGNQDQGDLVHPVWCIEVFCPGRGKPLNLSQKLKEAKVEAANAGKDRYCVIARHTGYPIDQSFFVTDLGLAVSLGIELDLRLRGGD